MRDRFPLLVVGGVVFLAMLGSFLMKTARRGSFADRYSTFRSEPDGARALYLLLEQEGLRVERVQRSLEHFEAHQAIIMVGTRFDDDRLTSGTAHDGSDAGVELDDESFNEFKRQGLSSLHVPSVSADERKALLNHVRDGATLVYLPPSWRTNSLLDELGVTLVRAAPTLDMRTLVPALPAALSLGVQTLETRVAAFIELPAQGVPWLVDDVLGDVVGAIIPWGQGQVIVITAPELATNKRLALADNARFWSSLVRELSTARPVAFDEFHHGFTGQRSIGEFAARYHLQYAVLQLLFGVALWALALRRFGRPHAPVENVRAGTTDLLAATSRIYREGKHHAHAADAIARHLAADFAYKAGLSGRHAPTEISAALASTGFSQLSHELLEVVRAAQATTTDGELREVARRAAHARRHLHPVHAKRKTP